MGSTIAPNAGKHATFESLTMTAPTDGMAQIVCKFDGDPRLIAGASMVVAHVARRAGLEEPALGELAAAAANVCEAMARTVQLAPDSRARLQLTATEFPDRLEISADVLPDSAAASSSNPSSDYRNDFVSQIGQGLKGSALDDLKVELRSGMPHVTFVKNCGTSRRKFAR